jgi:hypothetical protein
MKRLVLFFLILFKLPVEAQNVGIGTLTPASRLHIKGETDTTQLIIEANATQGNARPLMKFRNSNGNDLLWIHADDTSNIFIGRDAGRLNNAAGGAKDNIFIGPGTGYSNTIGFSNIGIGSNVFYKNMTGAFNTGIGWHSLYSNTTGQGNSALGEALEYNTTGSYNTGLGHGALYSNTAADFNTAAGSFALFSNITGGSNSASGFEALRNNTVGSFNTAVGARSLYFNNSSHNTAVGYDALFNNTGLYNTAVGSGSLLANTTGNSNTATGVIALYGNTSGAANTATGYFSLGKNTTGGFNTASGNSSLSDNTTGSYNVASGYHALSGNTSGSRNVGIGYWTLSQNADANYNTAVGDEAGRGHLHGWNNTFIGAGSNAAGTAFFNCIAIGANAITTASNQVRIGNSSNNSIGGYANWTNISDGRFKKNIKENVEGLSFIMQLRPITYQLDMAALNKSLHIGDNESWNTDMEKAAKEKEQTIQTGFVAQEVEAAAQQLGYDFSGVDKPGDANDFYGLRYAEFVVPLVKAVQEQQLQIQLLQNQLNNIKKQFQLITGKPFTHFSHQQNIEEAEKKYFSPGKNHINHIPEQ